MELGGWLSLLFIPAVLIVLGVHELGHLVAALALGVKPLEFGFGIPPRAASFYTGTTTIQTTPGAETALINVGVKRAAWVNVRETHDGQLLATSAGPRKPRGRREATRPGHTTITGRIRAIRPGEADLATMQWTIGMIPIGAFVRVAEGNGGPMAMESASHKRQSLILLAGVAANLILPIFALSAATVTASIHNGLVIANPDRGSPAWNAGVRPGDRIVAIGDEPVRRVRDTRSADRRLETAVTVTLRMPEGDRTVSIEPEQGGAGAGLEATSAFAARRPGDQLQKVPVTAAHNTVHMYRVIGEEIGGWFRPGSSPDLISPIGAARETGEVVAQGRVTGWLVVVAIFSANVGIANLLPVMPLDGGRLALVGLRAALRGRQVNRLFEASIAYGGLAAIVSITLTLIIRDITELLGG